MDEGWKTVELAIMLEHNTTHICSEAGPHTGTVLKLLPYCEVTGLLLGLRLFSYE